MHGSVVNHKSMNLLLRQVCDSIIDEMFETLKLSGVAVEGKEDAVRKELTSEPSLESHSHKTSSLHASVPPRQLRLHNHLLHRANRYVSSSAKTMLSSMFTDGVLGPQKSSRPRSRASRMRPTPMASRARWRRSRSPILARFSEKRGCGRAGRVIGGSQPQDSSRPLFSSAELRDAEFFSIIRSFVGMLVNLKRADTLRSAAADPRGSRQPIVRVP